ncbi:MAG: type II secretion system protein [Planctomycetota bacterium]|nr:type II secretion system protein [Planctomycetota bacterium]
MMKSSATHSVRGFTLIEMLVVIGIIAVLVMVVVGVSQLVIDKTGKTQTKLNMEVIHQAIEAYSEVKGNYPPDEDDFSDPYPDYSDRDWRAYKRGVKLYDELSSVPQARARLANLGKDAIMNIDGNNVFVDGFDKYMEYFSDHGAGGTPVVISAGGDGRFGTDAEPEYKKDNIRSDNQ